MILGLSQKITMMNHILWVLQFVWQIKYWYYYLGLFKCDHPSNYQDCCMQWLYFSLSNSGYGQGNSLSTSLWVSVCKSLRHNHLMLIQQYHQHGVSGSSYPSMVSHHLEFEDAESKYFLVHISQILLILIIAVSDGGFNPSTPATTYHNLEPQSLLHHYPDVHPALKTFPRTQATPIPEVSQTTGNKWKETPPTTSAETTIVTKRIKVEGSGSRGRIHAANFDKLTWSIIKETISIYHAQIGSVEPFPECANDWDTVKQARVKVCTGWNLWVKLEENIFKLVSDSNYFPLLVTMISPCRLLVMLRKQEGMLNPFWGCILYPHTRLTAMDQNARFVTALNNS